MKFFRHFGVLLISVMDSKKLDFVHLRFEIIVWLNKIIDFVWSWSPIKTRNPDLKKLVWKRNFCHWNFSSNELNFFRDLW